jgi:hypothetical protein
MLTSAPGGALVKEHKYSKKYIEICVVKGLKVYSVVFNIKFPFLLPYYKISYYKLYLTWVESCSSLFIYAGFESWKTSDIYWYWFVDTIFFFSSFMLKDIENGITNMNILFATRYVACLRGKRSENCK